MPAYVITPSSLGRIGETIDATLCDPSGLTGSQESANTRRPSRIL